MIQIISFQWEYCVVTLEVSILLTQTTSLRFENSIVTLGYLIEIQAFQYDADYSIVTLTPACLIDNVDYVIDDPNYLIVLVR